jgi:LAO/AO transport system kinase
VDIARLAHTTLVVEAPGLGDDIQAIKAGILEIADILVVNKADRPGVENTEKALKSMLDLAHPTQRVYTHHGTSLRLPPNSANLGGEKEGGGEGSRGEGNMWIPPVLKTVATEGTGIPELAEQITRHAEHLRVSGDWAPRERARLASELETVLQETLMNQFHERVSEATYRQILSRVFERSLSPWEAVKMLMNGRSK